MLAVVWIRASSGWTMAGLNGLTSICRRLLNCAGVYRWREGALSPPSSVLDDSKTTGSSPERLTPRPFMFAEGVLPYFERSQVKSLLLKMRDNFPGAELGAMRIRRS